MCLPLHFFRLSITQAAFRGKYLDNYRVTQTPSGQVSAFRNNPLHVRAVVTGRIRERVLFFFSSPFFFTQQRGLSLAPVIKIRIVRAARKHTHFPHTRYHKTRVYYRGSLCACQRRAIHLTDPSELKYRTAESWQL